MPTYCHASVAVTCPIGNESALITERFEFDACCYGMSIRMSITNFAKSPPHPVHARDDIEARVSRLPVYPLFPPPPPPLIDSVDFQVVHERNSIHSSILGTLSKELVERKYVASIVAFISRIRERAVFELELI